MEESQMRNSEFITRSGDSQGQMLPGKHFKGTLAKERVVDIVCVMFQCPTFSIFEIAFLVNLALRN